MEISNNIQIFVPNNMGRKIKHNYLVIQEEHKKGFSLKFLSKKYNIPLQSIYSHFQNKKISYNKDIVPRRKGYTVNDNYFDIIDTEEKAYLLGWMFSDGNVYKDRFSLKLKKEDGYMIEKLYSLFSNNYKLSENTKKTSLSKIISSKQITNKLKELGCIENKTLNGFSIPKISEHLFRHYLRGYFDGDGTISIRSDRPNQRQISICSIDKQFLEQLKNKLLEMNINTNISEEIRAGKSLKTPEGKILTNCKNMYRLCILTHKDRLKFYEFLYKNCSIKLERKYVLYNEYYTNTVLILENKDSKTVQRIGNETLINYDLLNEKTFKGRLKNIIFPRVPDNLM